MPLPRRNLLAGIAVSGAALIAAPFWRDRMTSPDAPRLVQAALGDSIDRVAAASSQPLKRAGLYDDDLLAVEDPVRFAYRGAHAFEPPPTRFLSLTLTAAVVTEIEFAPQLDYLDQTRVLALFDGVMRQALAAGWTRSADQATITGREEFAVLARDPAQRVDNAWHLARLVADGAILLFRLRRLHPNAFLLNLSWTDDALADRAYAVVKRLRAEDGVSPDLTRPVDARYAARAAALFNR